MDKKNINPESVMRQMERMMGESAEGKTKEQAAQELVYDSWECKYPDDSLELLEEAIDLDPTNIDAWLGTMDFYELEDDERIDALRGLKEKTEKKLGKKYFKSNEGYFWGVMETRPYMRVCNQLALKLMAAGNFEDSIIENEEMLELNPNDNQGVRYRLITCYLVLKRLSDAQRLLDKYKDDTQYGAAFAWAHVLERFLSNELDDAKNVLIHAKKVNGYANAYFLGHRNLPKIIPDSYTMGSKEEAIITWEMLRPAWKAHPEALSWLKNKGNK